MGTEERGGETEAKELDEIPPAPSSCNECDGSSFTSRSLPPSNFVKTSRAYVFAYHECDECGAKYNKQLPDEYIASFEKDVYGRGPDWEEIFGHPSPYEHQEDAVPSLIETAKVGQSKKDEYQGKKKGFTLMEGGCGTGKTMISLTAALQLVRDPSTKYDQVMVLTSVKQQLRQFEDDIRIINQNLPDDIPPARALTLVGKGDLCPYAREEVGKISPDNVASQCRRLRDQTSEMMASGSDGTALAEVASVDEDSDERTTWETGGVQSPYINAIPQDDWEYCPFYSNYKELGDPMFTFGHSEDCVIDLDNLVEHSVRNGVCPHSAMSTLLSDADIVFANYYHAWDENTLNITYDLIDDSTYLICDEAHMMEPRVRSVLTTDANMSAFNTAIGELASLYNAVRDDEIAVGRASSVVTPSQTSARENMFDGGVTPEMLHDAVIVLENMESVLDTAIQNYLNDEYPEWHPNSGKEPPEKVEIPLRNPENPEPDVLTKWANKKEIPSGFWGTLGTITDVVSETLTNASTRGDTEWAIEDVGRLLSAWFSRGNVRYFREVMLERRPEEWINVDVDDGGDSVRWSELYMGRISIESVMPQLEISSRVTSFGGGVLMSATLEPIDIYEEVIGLAFEQQFNDNGVYLSERVYTSDFPESNRDSIMLDLPKFTYTNRGDVDDNSEVREKYSQAIRDVCRTTPGNVMVAMPSYREATWAAEIIRDDSDIDKPVLVDKSSSEEQTQLLKEEFFEGEPKVLVTSLRGTLTEGVDFDGDKLLASIVVGVPIDNVSSPKTQAVRAAYEERVASGYAFGLLVPAVRKTRQAFGRVIRGDSDVGVRVIADERYVKKDGVRPFLSDEEVDEFDVVDDLSKFEDCLDGFWESKSE